MINNHALMSDTNVHEIISEIINHPEISRSEISHSTGINKATVSAVVKKLIDQAYVVETGTGSASTSGGRKPILLKINKKSGVSISFDIRFDKVSYMVNHLNGDVIEVNSIEKNMDRKNVVPTIEKIFLQIKEKLTSSPFGIIGIAIAIHGIISNNQIVFTPYYDLSQIDLQKELEERLKVPILIENEANLAAMAEAALDVNHTNIITCSIHTGIGAGIIIEGKLYKGYQGQSGEIGHTTLYPGGIQCPCGNKGCFEQYCSHNAIVNFYRKANQDGLLNLNDLIVGYMENDYVALKIIDEFSKNLSIGIANLLGTYGPDILLINSEIVRALPVILKNIQDRLSQTIYKGTPVRLSKVSRHASLYGATVLNIENFFGVDSLQLSFNKPKE